MLEIWKSIYEVDGDYEISNHGRIRSVDRYVDVYRKNTGYHRQFIRGRLISTSNNIFYLDSFSHKIHRYVDTLVLQYFSNLPYDDWKIIIHKDGDISNSSLDNLEVIDPFEDKEEIWRYTLEYPKEYMVSSKGRLLRCPGTRTISSGRNRHNRCMFIKPGYDCDGYLMAELPRNKNTNGHVRIHRLVAGAFLSNPDNLPEVNHKDANKSNNYVDNLEWCTTLDNQLHARKLGLVPITKPSSKKVRCVELNLIFDSFVDASEYFSSQGKKITANGISNLAQGKTKHSYKLPGLTFQLVE